MEMVRATQHFKWIVATFSLTPIGAEGDYEIITVMQFAMQLILYTHGLILHHFIYIWLHTASYIYTYDVYIYTYILHFP